MTILARETFTGYGAPATSGAAPFPAATDGAAAEIWMAFAGTPATDDSFAFTLQFSTGDVTLRARWTSSTTLILERISTIPGTNNGTATLSTFTGTSTQKPRSDGDLCRIQLTVTRGAADGLTAIGYTWNGRGGTTGGTTGSFNVDGELTTDDGSFAVVGSSFRNRPNLQGRTPDGGGTPSLALGTWSKLLGLGDPGIHPLVERETVGIETDEVARPQLAAFNDTLYALTGTGADPDQLARVTASFTDFPTIVLAVRLSGSWPSPNGYVLFVFGDDPDAIVELYRYTGGGFTFLDSAFLTDVAGTPHDWDLAISGSSLQAYVDSVDIFASPITDTTHTTGDPGLGAMRDSRASAAVDLLVFEVDTAAVGPDPCEDPGGTPITDITDDWSGGDAADITGRTPPGASPAVWCGPITGSGGALLGIADGKLVAAERETDAHYVLIAAGLTDYRATLADIEFQVLGSGWASVLGRFRPGLNGYELVLGGNGILGLYRVTAGSYTELASAVVTLEAGIPVELVLDLSGNTLQGYLNGALKVSASDSTYPTGGSPGINLTNGETGTLPTVTAGTFTIAGSGGGGWPAGDPPTGMPTTVAIDHFTGAPDQNIDGRAADGVAYPGGGDSCYADGVWQQGPPDSILSVENAHDIPAALEGIWKGTGHFTLLDGDVTSGLVRSWQDVTPGDLLLLVMYTRIGSLHPQVPSGWDEVINQDNSSFSGHLVIASREVQDGDPDIWSVTLTGTPNLASERTVLQIYAFRQGTVVAASTVETWLTQQNLGPIGGVPSSPTSALFAVGAKQHRLAMSISGAAPIVTVDEGFSIAGYASATAGTPGPTDIGPGVAFVAGWLYDASGVAAPSLTFTDTVQGGNPSTNGAGMGAVLEIGLASFPPDPGPGILLNRTFDYTVWPSTSAANAPVILTDIAALSGVEAYMVEALVVLHDLDRAELVKVYVLMDAEHGLGYSMTYFITEDQSALVQFRHYGPGFPLFTTAAPSYPAGTPIRLRLCVAGTAGNGISDFKGYVNDILVGEVSHFFDASSWPLGATPIWPGIMLRDKSNYWTGKATSCDYVRVALSCDAPYPWDCYPCEGPPENPYPEDPPPPGAFPSWLGYWRYQNGLPRWICTEYLMQHGAYRKMIGEDVPPEEIRRYFQQIGIPRPSQVLCPGGDTDPPPNTDLPPYFDPCELLGPPELPPTEPLGDPPDRIFFAWAHPITQLGPLFTGAPNALGPHSVTNLAQAAARDSYIIGAQGGYDKFIGVNPMTGRAEYSASLMDAWIASHASYMGTLMADPHFYGVSIIDDFASFERWHWPIGWTLATVVSEISRLAALWKTLYPGLRIGLRARAAQFTAGTGLPSNIDFVIAQYRYWGGLGTPAQFRDTELSLTHARGWDILWSVNIENGGLGASGITHKVMYEMTPAEVLGAWLTFLDRPVGDQFNVHGMGLWQYSAAVFGRTGMLDAFAIGRNALAALGAP